MLKLFAITLGFTSVICTAAVAQSVGDAFPDLPPLPAGSVPSPSDAEPLPELPAMPDLPSDAPAVQPPPQAAEIISTLPEAIPPQPLPVPNDAPLAADSTSPPLPTADPALPPITNQSDFDFFQQGAQLPPLPPTPAPAPLPEALPILDETAEDSPSKPETISYDGELSSEHKRPLKRSFNYKIQHLSPAIYRKQYSPQNRHLPVAHTRADYTLATFKAAATNNLNGLRAMLEYGGQSIDMRTPNGESLADIAARYGAHTTLRYLIARGAPRG